MSADILAFLSTKSVDSILSTHPNRLFTPEGCATPPEWASWWAWAGNENSETRAKSHTPDAKWLLIMRYYSRTKEEEGDPAWMSIPQELRSLVDAARRMQVSREMGGHALYVPKHDIRADLGPSRTVTQSEEKILGMSPKKAHEIVRMSAYLSTLLSTSPELVEVIHAVDVGAGQSFLSRDTASALRCLYLFSFDLFNIFHTAIAYTEVHQAYLSRAMRDQLGLHVLALDWSDVQSKGAARREVMGPKKWKKRTDCPAKLGGHASNAREAAEPQAEPHEHRGSLTYRTLEIRSDSLLHSVDAWTEEMRANQHSSGSPLPTLFVALHACGSLTPNLLRAFISRIHSHETKENWSPRAAVIVGCCYNLLEPGDFPLSRKLKELSEQTSTATFTPNHLHLATQTPGQWLRTEETLAAAALAIRKVVWRALLQGILEKHDLTSAQARSQQCDAQLDETAIVNGETPALRRLGRLNDSVYSDWTTFLARAQERLGVKLDPAVCEKDAATESRLEVLQVLRCTLGPVIESLILLDREDWLQDELKGTGMDIRLVNLFDQACGSARNVAIVIKPTP